MDAAELKQELGTVKELIVDLEAQLKEVSNKLTSAQPDEKARLQGQEAHLQRRLELAEDERRLLLKAVAGKNGAHKDDITGVATKNDIHQLRLEFEQRQVNPPVLEGFRTPRVFRWAIPYIQKQKET